MGAAHGAGDAVTEKEEQYCQARAEGLKPAEAYRSSRDASRMSPATIAANAKKLERRPHVKARIEELRRESQVGAPQESSAERESAGESPPQPAAAPEPAVTAAPKTAGRPTAYSPEIADEILDRLAAGEPLRTICRDEGMPAESTVRAWSLDQNHPISARYARAREAGFWSMADEMLEIADDSRNDWIEKVTRSGDTITVVNEEAIGRARLRVATRQWTLAKMLPAFGDRLSAELSGPDGAPLVEVPDKRDIARAVLDIFRSAKIADAPASDDPDDPEDPDDDGADPADYRATPHGPLPDALEAGERELIGDDGIEIRLLERYGKYGIYDGAGKYLAMRDTLAEARAYTESLGAPPPAKGPPAAPHVQRDPRAPTHRYNSATGKLEELR